MNYSPCHFLGRLHQANWHSERPDSGRADRLDALRALAMLWMTLYHFCFDLNLVGYWRQNLLHDPLWVWQRVAIVSLFMFCAGVGQALALQQGQNWARFGRRWLQVAGAALLVSAGTYALFPDSYIYFGVLHGLALMLLVLRLSAAWGRWLWLAGAFIFALYLIAPYAVGTGASAEFFNQKSLNWLGWISRKPITQDYVPVLPWLGLLWWSMAGGQWCLRRRPHWLLGPLRQRWQPLARLGRWSLSYYLLHQPVLLGLLMALGWLARATQPG